jgi:hypothetical protein
MSWGLGACDRVGAPRFGVRFRVWQVRVDGDPDLDLGGDRGRGRECMVRPGGVGDLF